MHHNAFQILITVQTLLMWFSRTTGDNYWIIDCQWISLYWRTCAWQRIWWYVSTIALLPSKFQIWVLTFHCFFNRTRGCWQSIRQQCDHVHIFSLSHISFHLDILKLSVLLRTPYSIISKLFIYFLIHYDQFRLQRAIKNDVKFLQGFNDSLNWW